MECSTCGGPAHPATGCQYTETFIACGACTRRFWAWFMQHQYRGVGTAKRTGVPTFYDCVRRFTR